MLYDELAEAHSDLSWTLFELALQVGDDHPALIKASFALQRLERVVADLSGMEEEASKKHLRRAC